MEYIKQWERQFKKQLCKDYHHHLKVFTTEAPFNLLTASFQNILSYIAIRRDLGDSVYTLNNKVSSIKKYYQCLLELGIITHHPCKHLVLKDKYDTRIDFNKLYSTQTLESFLKRTSQSSKSINKRNQIIRGLLVYQALTVKEICLLKIQDIDLEKAVVTIVNSRELSLHSKQIIEIYCYLETYRKQLLKGKTTAIFLLSNNGNPLNTEHISSLVNHGFDRKLKPKLIRQSVIHNLLREGKDLRSVQLFAGHKSIVSTEKYRNNKFEELKSSLQLLHPLNHIK